MPAASRPKRVLVGPVRYGVSWVKHKREAYGNWGAFVSEPGKPAQIIIVESDSLREATYFLHEVLHALFFEMASDVKRMDEEDVVNTTAALLTKFWQDNPSSLRWYCEAIKK